MTNFAVFKKLPRHFTVKYAQFTIKPVFRFADQVRHKPWQLVNYKSKIQAGKFRLSVSRVMRKPAFYICENKSADQLRGNPEADQRLCFRYMDSTIPLLPKSEISSL